MKPVGLQFSLFLLLYGLGTGCQSYRQQPLVPQELITLVERDRAQLPRDGSSPEEANRQPEPFSFVRAARILAEHGPELKVARAEYETALAVAQIETPLPNPSLDVGPTFGFGSDVKFNPVAPGANLGFTIPLNSRLAREDELNRAQAEIARIVWVVRQREEFMELRLVYAQVALGHKRCVERKAVAEGADQTVEASKKLVAAGMATALDQGLLEMDAGQTQLSVMEAESELADGEGRLSELLGVDRSFFGGILPEGLPRPGGDLPSSDGLKDVLIDNHPELVRLRAEYEAAERALRLEIERQYPDLRIGTSISGDTGSHKTNLGLTLGIDLPIFDHNEQAIATAYKKREEIRIKYMAAANRALAGVDRAMRACHLAADKRLLLQTVLMPRAQANRDLARRSLDLGQTDMLRFLEAQRALRQTLADGVEAELGEIEAWVGLEQALGRPVLRFPDEDSLTLPSAPSDPAAAPERLTAPASAAEFSPAPVDSQVVAPATKAPQTLAPQKAIDERKTP